ncbi:MAG: hypothetical protein HQ475_06100 [SAR202 cluster bacterium]|nr:hypothetical protein [SAR202 cluster bacterium]
MVKERKSKFRHIQRFTGARVSGSMRLIGEKPGMSRTLAHWIVFGLFYSILMAPIAVYILKTELVAPISDSRFSILVVAPILGGLALAASPGFRDRSRLIQVAQKFLMATVFFIIFLPSIEVVNSKGDINWKSFDDGSDALIRGLYFWLAAFSFFGGIFLFLLGLVDLVFTLAGIKKRPVRKKPSQSPPLFY